MANQVGRYKINRTGVATWEVVDNGATVGSYTTRTQALALAHALHGGSNATAAAYVGGRKTATAEVQVITLTGFSGTDSFKCAVTEAGVTSTTVAFVRGTNATAAAIQTALRTATGDTGLTVSGTTDEGPFTVTFVETTIQPLIDVVEESGCTGAVTVSTQGGIGW